MIRLVAERVVVPTGVIRRAMVTVTNGVIVDIEPATGSVPDVTIVPGFVDLQVNGIGEVDVASADGDDWDVLDHALVGGGTTTWCPTLTSAALDEYAAPLARIAAAATRLGPRPRIAGAHLEGPFLALPGAHAPALLRAPDPQWLHSLDPIVSVVTLSPELPGAIEAITVLRARGVLVAIGHSAADHDTVVMAARAGARMVTHLFNACGPFDPRAPGVVGAALGGSDLAVSLIADLEHVHPAALALAARAAGPTRTVLVTDSVAHGPRDASGRLMGSRLAMYEAVAHLVEDAGIDVVHAVAAASATPAALLGLADRGRVEPGLRADLCALDEHYRPVGVWIGGTRVLDTQGDIERRP